MMRCVRALTAVALLLASGTASGKDCSQCHKLHLTGEDFSAWRSNAGDWGIVQDATLAADNEKRLAVRPGTGAMVNGPTGRTRHLFSEQEFGDVRAHIEFTVAKDSNSGVYFMGRYEVQVFDSWQKESPYPGIECGGIYQRWDDSRDPKGFEGHSPRLNVSRPPGQWQTFDVVFRSPRFDGDGRKIANARFEKVIHNGTVVHADLELTGPTRASAYSDERPQGVLMLQGDHGPVAYRNVWVAPAGPNPFFAMDTATNDPNHPTIHEQAPMLEELGYAGIGVGFERTDSLVETLRVLDKHGLRLFSVYTGVDLDPDKPPYDPKLKDAIEALAGRNAVLWLFVRSKTYERSSPDGDPRAVQILRDLAVFASRHKVRLSLYPHHGFWLETVEDAIRVANEVEDAIRVANQVAPPTVGVTFNLCHWLRVNEGTDAEQILRAAMPRLSVVTINGADTDGQDWKTLIQTLDRGTFDLLAFLETVRDAGYTGPIGFQGYGIGGDAYDNLKRSMAAWEKHNMVLRGDVTPFGEPREP